MKIRELLTRVTQFFLGLDGVLHVAEVISAYREEAWMTFGLTSAHACIFFLAVYFIGHDHTHHKSHTTNSEPVVIDDLHL
jgi:hypothetical protein